MAQYIAEVTVVIEMNDGGGLSTPDNFATIAQGLVSVGAHAWVTNSKVGRVYVRSGDVPLSQSADIAPSEG